jgi:hypothetical protein
MTQTPMALMIETETPDSEDDASSRNNLNGKTPSLHAALSGNEGDKVLPEEDNEEE